MKIAVVGATGLVGTVLLDVIKEYELHNNEIILVASEKSVGKKIYCFNKELEVVSIENALLQKPEIAIFSAGSKLSIQYAPKFVENNCFVIDNSSAWRSYENIPLVVPEINADTINKNTKIIANPNCSTIQMVLAVAPLHKIYKIKRLIISTYQSVSGTGAKAVKQLENERNGAKTEMAYNYQIDLNVIPHGGDFLENGYTTEEMKLVDETQKILNDKNINITATVVRVPVLGGHSETINIEFFNNFEINDIYKILNDSKGIVVQDDISKNIYPMPLFAKNKNDVFVGRIRRDYSNQNTLNLWIVADNLRKGAATNAIQIAKYLINNKFV